MVRCGLEDSAEVARIATVGRGCFVDQRSRRTASLAEHRACWPSRGGRTAVGRAWWWARAPTVGTATPPATAHTGAIVWWSHPTNRPMLINQHPDMITGEISGHQRGTRWPPAGRVNGSLRGFHWRGHRTTDTSFDPTRRADALVRTDRVVLASGCRRGRADATRWVTSRFCPHRKSAPGRWSESTVGGSLDGSKSH